MTDQSISPLKQSADIEDNVHISSEEMIKQAEKKESLKYRSGCTDLHLLLNSNNSESPKQSAAAQIISPVIQLRVYVLKFA